MGLRIECWDKNVSKSMYDRMKCLIENKEEGKARSFIEEGLKQGEGSISHTARSLVRSCNSLQKADTQD